MPDPTSSSSSATDGTQSIQRAAALLRLLTAHHRTGLRLVDLYRKAALGRTTAHRILQGLVAERLAAQDQRTRRYFLGPLVYEMGLAAAPRLQLRDVCHPHLLHLARESGDTVFLTARAELDGVCLDRAEGAFPVKVFVLEVGRHRPLGVGGGGLAILAGLDEAESRRILRANDERLVARFPRYDAAGTTRVVAAARRRGYVLSDVLEVPGIRTLALPIRTAPGRAVAGLSVSTMAQRLEPRRIGTLVALMQQAVNAIEDELRDRPDVETS